MQDSHMFETLNSLSFPRDFQGKHASLLAHFCCDNTLNCYILEVEKETRFLQLSQIQK